VLDDGERKETVMVTPSAPLITVTGEAGMTHSYPQRTFKPEAPKTETVTLKTDGETASATDHTLFACVSLAVVGSIALAGSRVKSMFRSPVSSPEVGVELLSKSGTAFLDLEDQEPIAEPTWASSAVERALAAAEAK
jgi:hypothetical protein